MTTPKIITRVQWGARVPAGVMADLANPAFVVVHHTTGAALGHPDIAQFVRNIQSYHINGLDWSDIGYHWLVDPNTGDIYEGRAMRWVGAHVGRVTTGVPVRNSNSVGIALLGDSDEGALPDAAKASLRWLIEQQRAKQVFPHSMARATHCPGDELREWLASGMRVPTESRPRIIVPVAPRRHPAWPGRYIELRQPMMRGQDIRIWQQQMRKRGWRRMKLTGIFGPISDDLLRQFQREHGLVVDGVLGPLSWRAAWERPIK